MTDVTKLLRNEMNLNISLIDIQFLDILKICLVSPFNIFKPIVLTQCFFSESLRMSIRQEDFEQICSLYLESRFFCVPRGTCT